LPTDLGRQVLLLKFGRLSGKYALTPIFYHKERALWALLAYPVSFFLEPDLSLANTCIAQKRSSA
jgi:hypothetical protein